MWKRKDLDMGRYSLYWVVSSSWSQRATKWSYDLRDEQGQITDRATWSVT